jgi:neutral ceramidase
VAKVIRIALRVSSGLVVVLLLAGVLCFDGVEYQPYYTAPYYKDTAQRLHELATNQNLVTGELAAGFGRALLTPSLNATRDEPQQGRFRSVPLAGYGNRKGKPATGPHDDLYVKAVAFRVEGHVGLMVSADALIIPREVAVTALEPLSAELHLKREQIFFSATHTHASLGGWGEGMVAEAFAGPFQPGIRTWMAGQIVAAVHAALSDLRPASIGHGSFAAPEYVRNRLVGSLGRVDPEFSYLLVKQEEGKTAVLGSYAAHATVLSSSVMEFSADYPGCWQRAVEQATGGIAVFLGGGVGSHAPVAGAGGFAGTERMGQALARAVLGQLPGTALTNRITFGTLGLPVSLPPLNARVSDGWRLRPWLAKRLLPVGDQTLLQAFRLGEAVWISTPCDFSGELALDIKASLRRPGFQTTITSFNGDYIGYVVSSRYYHSAGYEPRLMSFFGPNVPDYFEELIRGLFQAIAVPSS